jgi:hypothetical protein
MRPTVTCLSDVLVASVASWSFHASPGRRKYNSASARAWRGEGGKSFLSAPIRSTSATASSMDAIAQCDDPVEAELPRNGTVWRGCERAIDVGRGTGGPIEAVSTVVVRLIHLTPPTFRRGHISGEWRRLPSQHRLW